MATDLLVQEQIQELVNVVPRVWADQGFMALPRNGNHYEIINGELVQMGDSCALHGYLCSLLLAALMNHVLANKLGIVFDSSTAFKLKNGDKRSPDIAFWAKERLQGMTKLPPGLLEGAPNLAIGVLSPSNRIAEIEDKITEYFENGSRSVWLVSPNQQYIMIYHSPKEPDRLLKSGNILDGEDIVPGFKLAIAELFENLNYYF